MGEMPTSPVRGVLRAGHSFLQYPCGSRYNVGEAQAGSRQFCGLVMCPVVPSLAEIVSRIIQVIEPLPNPSNRGSVLCLWKGGETRASGRYNKSTILENAVRTLPTECAGN